MHSLNTVLGRHGQTQFEAGEIDPWAEKRRAASEKGTEFVIGIDDQPDLRIPGRTVILKQDKWDVSGLLLNLSFRVCRFFRRLILYCSMHLFRWVPTVSLCSNKTWWWLPPTCRTMTTERRLEDNGEHYSKTHVKTGIYGVDKLYTDKNRANEDIRIHVDGGIRRFKQHL